MFDFQWPNANVQCSWLIIANNIERLHGCSNSISSSSSGEKQIWFYANNTVLLSSPSRYLAHNVTKQKYCSMSAMFNAILHLIRNAVAVIMFSPSPPPSPPHTHMGKRWIICKVSQAAQSPTYWWFCIGTPICSSFSNLPRTFDVATYCIYGDCMVPCKTKQMSVRVNNNFAKNIP